MKKIKKWQEILFALFILIFILIILFRFAEIKEITLLIKQVNYFWFVIAIILQFAVFAALAGLYKSILFSVKDKISFFYLFKTAIAMLFVDHAMPSFSASGNVLLYYAARKAKIKKDKSALVIGLNIFINFLFFFIILIFGLSYLLITQKFDSWILFFIIVIFLICFILMNRIIWTKTGRCHFESVLSWLTHKFPKTKKRTLAILSNFYNAKKEFNKKRFFLLFFYVFLVYLFKILVIAAIFLSLGYLINFGILIVGYIIATALSLASYIRIGVYEASMTLGYSMMGIPYNLALTATLLYRAVSFWLMMLIGLILFRSIIKKKK